MEVSWRQEFVVGMAEAMTGQRGYEALRQFSKQLVLGAYRDVGEENMEHVFSEPLLALDDLRVLTRMTWANDAARYRWVFDEGWVRMPDAWAERGCDGVVLVGMDDDADFFFVDAQEASGLLEEWDGVLTVPMDHDALARWKDQWFALLKNREICDG